MEAVGRESGKFIVDSGQAATFATRGLWLDVRGSLSSMEKLRENLSLETKASITIAHVAVDHLVIAAPTLELATEYVADALGIRPAKGGAHPGRGTHNAILGLAARGETRAGLSAGIWVVSLCRGEEAMSHGRQAPGYR